MAAILNVCDTTALPGVNRKMGVFIESVIMKLLKKLGVKTTASLNVARGLAS